MKIDLSYLKEKLPLSIEYFDTIDSTSLYLKRRIKDKLSVPNLVIAGVQTNGQGRVGRNFYSPGETGLYLTFCFPVDLVKCQDLTPRVALCVLTAIGEVFSVSPGLKWVNDIYLKGKKVSGVLCQKIDNFYLIGIGINVEEPRDIPEDLLSRFGSVCTSCEDECYTKLVLSLYENLKLCFQMKKGVVLEAFRKRCIHIGSSVSVEYNNESLKGVCIGIDDDFALLLQTNGEVRKITSGFMSLKLQ